MDKNPVSYYIQQLKTGNGEDAYFGLLELGPSIIPELTRICESEADPETKATLVEVIWQSRLPAVIPFLAETVKNAEPEVWKAALDGLVTLAGPESIRALEDALSAAPLRGKDRETYREWVSEALSQAMEQVNLPAHDG